MWLAFGRVASGVAAAGLALELLFRILPTSTATRTGYHVSQDMVTYPPGHAFRTSFGWALDNAQQHRANNYGFVADHDFVFDATAVAVVGDSYVEATMLPAQDRFAAQLERLLPGRAAYAMGSPGSSLLDYAARVQFASSRFGTRDFVVVVEEGDIAQALCGSGQVHAHCLDPRTLNSRVERRQSNQSAAANLLRRSALAQYLFSQLKIDPARWSVRIRKALSPNQAPEGAGAERTRSAYGPWVDAVLQTFFERLGSHCGPRTTFVVLAPPRSSVKPRDEPRARFIAGARACGANVIDTEPLFQRHLNAGGVSLVVSPRDAHWNSLAVGLVARQTAPLLRSGSGS